MGRKLRATKQYPLDMDRQANNANTRPTGLIVGLAVINGKRFPKSLTTGRCYVNEVITELSSAKFTHLMHRRISGQQSERSTGLDGPDLDNHRSAYRHQSNMECT
jgi:hypothetical protein